MTRPFQLGGSGAIHCTATFITGLLLMLTQPQCAYVMYIFVCSCLVCNKRSRTLWLHHTPVSVFFL